MKQREYDDDDGHTIADMSDVSIPNSFLPRLPRKKERREGEEDIPDVPVGREERHAYILAAVCSALLIGLAFAVGLGLVIWLLTLLA